MAEPTPDPADNPDTSNTPDTDNPDNPTEEQLAEQTLQRELENYRRALESEYAASQVPGAETNLVAKVQDLYKDNAVKAAHDIIWLANNSTSDSVRFSALKHITTEAFKHAIADNDPYKQLLDQLTKKPSDTPTDHTEPTTHTGDDASS